MVGTLGGKPVRYFADCRRVLDGGFPKFNMIDTLEDLHSMRLKFSLASIARPMISLRTGWTDLERLAHGLSREVSEVVNG
jgi:hypothetical protein